MKFKVIVLIIAATIVAAGIYNSRNTSTDTISVSNTDTKMTVVATPDPYVGEKKSTKEVPYKVQEYVGNLNVPWAVVFTSDTRLLVTEREGKVRIIENQKLLENPLVTFSETLPIGEGGLLGIALDPNYQSNKFFYVTIMYRKNGNMVEKIVRVKDSGNTASVDKVLLDDIPAAANHDGGALRFGPDGKLYASTGDAQNKDNAQNKDSLSGKILRLNSDGTIPEDNPFPGSLVYSLGHRNPQGFDWYPQSKVMWETEHGPSGNDGPGGGDETNVIEPGQNYGWPVVSHDQSKDGLVDPKLTFTPAFAPASGMFYKGRVFPQFYGNFFFGGLRGEGIMRVVVELKSPSKVLSYGKLEGINYGRIRNIAEGPDGYIYFTTSNRDGRGSPRSGDDKIYRLVPESKK